MSRIRGARQSDNVVGDKRCPESGKTKFPTRKHALSTANYEAKRKGIRFYVYKCPHCRDWHMTRWTQERYERYLEAVCLA